MNKYREDERRPYREGPTERDRNEGRLETARGDYRPRTTDFGGERFGNYGSGRFGERAEYDNDEPRYGHSLRHEREGNGRSSYEEGREYLRQRFGEPRPARSRVRCRDIMTRDVTVATRNSSLEDVAKMMREEDAGVIPVVEELDGTSEASTTTGEVRRGNARNYGNGKLVGLITDRDIVVRAIAEGKDCRTTRAEEIMTTDIHTAKPNDRVIDAIRKMGDKQVRRIPIVGENDNLRGIIAMADVALETEEDRELAEALEEISSGSSFWSRMFS
jgi:CBS domain-containing protein